MLKHGKRLVKREIRTYVTSAIIGLIFTSGYTITSIVNKIPFYKFFTIVKTLVSQLIGSLFGG